MNLDKTWTATERWFTERVLPYCRDDELLAELAVVQSAGWGLPSRPARASSIPHLLVLGDDRSGSSYAEAAQRLLVMLDDAIRSGAVEDERGESLVSEDEALGLRILFGTYPNYRAVGSPVTRRADASDFLVAGWQAEPPYDRAGTFQRRHQTRALTLALECLRRTYGQEPSLESQTYDVVSKHHWLRIGPRHQIVQTGCSQLIRARQDNLRYFNTSEPEREPQGLLHAELQVLDHPLTPGATLIQEEDEEEAPGSRVITISLPKPLAIGETAGILWQEDMVYGDDAKVWDDYYSASHTSNDRYELTMTVIFDEEPAHYVWWYEAKPYYDKTHLVPHPGQELPIINGQASHTWTATSTRRYIDYGLQWAWKSPV